MKIAVDGMGGDYAPGVVVEGLTIALADFPEYEFVLVGHTAKLQFYLEKYGIADNPRVTLVHADTVCEMSEPSAIAVRKKRDSSITTCAKLLKEGAVDAMVTPGHTGATVAATKVLVRTLPGVDRPALAASLPARQGRFVLMDAGANPDCTPINLVQFAVMGGEDNKGKSLTKESFSLIEELPINFVGNVEADSIFEGASDVLIADGFSGNVLLKGIEGLAKSTHYWLKKVLTKNALRIIGASLAKSAFRELKAFGDADDIGGAPLLGINGICIIGHGSSSPKAVRNAIRVAAECVEFDLNGKIIAKLREAHATTEELNTRLLEEK